MYIFLNKQFCTKGDVNWSLIDKYKTEGLMLINYIHDKAMS